MKKLEKKTIIPVLVFVLVILAYMEEALAYIDPGTGGMIIGGSIWPFILAVFAAIGGFFLKCFFKPIKKGVSFIWKKVRRKD